MNKDTPLTLDTYSKNYKFMVGEYIGIFSNYEGLMNFFIFNFFFKGEVKNTDEHEEFFEKVLIPLNGTKKQDWCFSIIKTYHKELWFKHIEDSQSNGDIKSFRILRNNLAHSFVTNSQQTSVDFFIINSFRKGLFLDAYEKKIYVKDYIITRDKLTEFIKSLIIIHEEITSQEKPSA